MNDRFSPVQVRRNRPYLGLDYFTESDAPLFFERDRDSRECAEILMGFGVKILILQGSSGAGKSSFLRAGLVPYLKSKQEWRAHFLNDSDDDVIRCTSDPMKWIADATFHACDQLGAMQMAEAGSAVADDAPAPCVAPRDEALFRCPRKDLAEVVLDALECLCNELPGQLLLVLDQAEEVLTQRGSELNNDSSDAFFYFLSEVYIRNIDVRIVAALRTEYYGRFRDVLDIRDDRLGSRPRQGGVAPYLLRPIRDRQALIRIATAPASGETPGLYNYQFDPNVAARIVDDILKQELHGSVTPLLQAVCVVLYEDLGEQDRNIRLTRYEEMGALPGITDRYVRAGFRSVLGRVETKVLVRWYHLLFSLVSRQGGGTLVSEIETVEELRSRADDLQISADVEGALNKLCTSPWPLLRGQPPERPTQFSLKHDVLAGFFFRWKVGEDARRVQQKKDEEELRKVEQTNAATMNRLMFKTLLLATAILLVVVGTNIYRDFEAQVGDRLALAAAPPRSDYGLSLLSVLTSLDATRAYGILPFGLPTRALHQQSIAALRQTLIRSPWFDGKYVAVGVSPDHDHALLLRENGTIVQLALSPQKAAAGSSDTLFMLLPSGTAKPRPSQNVAVGFLDGLGPAVVIEGQLYYWRDGNPVKLADRWPPGLSNLSPLRYEFIGGALLVTGPRQSADGKRATYRYKITAADILGNRVSAVKEELVARITRVSPPPVFAESAGLADTVAYITQAAAANGNGTEGNGAAAPGTYGVNVARAGSGTWLDLPLPTTETGYQDYLPFSPAFVVNAAALLVQGSTGDSYWSPLATGAKPVARQGLGTISVAGIAPDKDALAPAQAYNPWIYSPLAAVQLPGTLRFAWLSDDGIWVADANPVPNQTVKAVRALGIPATLLMGEPGGSRLRFSSSGEFLMLQQQPYYGDTIQFRVWNLSPQWRHLIDHASEPQLMDMACAALKGSSQEWKNAKAIGLFKLPGASLEPCRPR